MKNYIDYTTFESAIKNLGLSCTKLDIIYNVSDHRCWTAIINPGQNNILVTFSINKHKLGDHYFDIITDNRTAMDVWTDDIYDIIADITNTREVLLDFNN